MVSVVRVSVSRPSYLLSRSLAFASRLVGASLDHMVTSAYSALLHINLNESEELFLHIFFAKAWPRARYLNYGTAHHSDQPLDCVYKFLLSGEL